MDADVGVHMARVARRATERPAPPLTLAGTDEHTVGAHLVAAQAQADVDSIRAQGRASLTKQAVLRVSRLFLTRQAAYNRELWHAVAELNHQLMAMRSQLAALSSELEQLRVREASHHATVTVRLDDLADRLETLPSRNGDTAPDGRIDGDSHDHSRL